MRCRLLPIVVLLLATVAPNATAQVAAPAGVAACSYDTCALRLSRGRLVRGASSERVGPRLNGWGGGVDLLLGGSDSAATHARSYVKNSRKAVGFALAAFVGHGVVLYQTSHLARGEDPHVGTALLFGGSVVTGAAALVFGARADEHLSRSMWWYNGALPR